MSVSINNVQYIGDNQRFFQQMVQEIARLRALIEAQERRIRLLERRK